MPLRGLYVEVTLPTDWVQTGNREKLASSRVLAENLGCGLNIDRNGPRATIHLPTVKKMNDLIRAKIEEIGCIIEKNWFVETSTTD